MHNFKILVFYLRVVELMGGVEFAEEAKKMAATPRMELEKMSVEHLRGLKEQVDMEVNLLQDSLNNIRSANARLEIASAALHDLSLRPQG